MKKIIALITLVFLFNSCMPDEGPKYTLELLPVASVDIPTEFTLGQTYPITMRYNKPTSCHFYNGIYYHKDLNIRTIAVETAVEERNNCQDTPNDESECTFNFLVTSNGSYTFKFWQGEDENGEDIFLEYEVPVVN